MKNVLNVVVVEPVVLKNVLNVVVVLRDVLWLVDLTVLKNVENDVVLEVERDVDNAVTLATNLAFNCFETPPDDVTVSVNVAPAALTYVLVPLAAPSDILKKNLSIN